MRKPTVEELEKELNALNEMLRRTGYGQGQIDSYAAICEERDELLAACNELIAWCEDNDVSCYGLDLAIEAAKKAKGDQ
jgi:hypothetical protein